MTRRCVVLPGNDFGLPKYVLTFDLVFLLVAAPAVVFAGVSKAGFGSGAAFASASILALILEPGVALGVMLPLLMLIDFGSLKPYWRQWSVPDVRLLALGALPGIIAGALLFQFASADLFRILIGSISVAFVVWQFSSARGLVRIAGNRMPDWMGGVLGAVVGFTTFVSHAGGPPAAIFLLGRGLSKTQFQATTVILFWLLNLIKFFFYAALGLFTAQTLLANLILAPFALLGTWIGVKAHHLVSEKAFFGITYVLLTLTGCKLIWDGLT